MGVGGEVGPGGEGGVGGGGGGKKDKVHDFCRVSTIDLYGNLEPAILSADSIHFDISWCCTRDRDQTASSKK